MVFGPTEMGAQSCVKGTKRRSVRLGVRTPDFHSGNTGSIPVRTTKNRASVKSESDEHSLCFFLHSHTVPHTLCFSVSPPSSVSPSSLSHCSSRFVFHVQLSQIKSPINPQP